MCSVFVNHPCMRTAHYILYGDIKVKKIRFQSSSQDTFAFFLLWDSLLGQIILDVTEDKSVTLEIAPSVIVICALINTEASLGDT